MTKDTIAVRPSEFNWQIDKIEIETERISTEQSPLNCTQNKRFCFAKLT